MAILGPPFFAGAYLLLRHVMTATPPSGAGSLVRLVNHSRPAARDGDCGPGSGLAGGTSSTNSRRAGCPTVDFGTRNRLGELLSSPAPSAKSASAMNRQSKFT